MRADIFGSSASLTRSDLALGASRILSPQRAKLRWHNDPQAFARSALDALQWLQQLDGSGVGLKILTQDIDPTSAAGRQVFTILAAVAEMERELIRERVRAGMARARSQGTRLGGRWRTLKGSLRVDPSSNGPRRTRVNVLWAASALARREARGSYLGRLANQDRAWCCQGGLVHGARVGTVPATRSNSGRCGAEQFRVEVA